MKTRPDFRRPAIAVCLLVALLGPGNLVSLAFTGGPPAGFTNAPGNSNCTVCHNSFPLNSGTANFGITAPLTYQPGSAQSVTVSFTGSTSVKHGFQITARDGAGIPSGSWSVVLAGMTQDATTPYHEHTAAGTALSSWTMNWNSPATLPQGPVTFYACGNDTNNNNSSSGDHIYASTTKLYQATLSTQTTTWPIGGSQMLTLAAPGHAGELYFIVPSDDPTPYLLSGPFVLEVTPNNIFYSVVNQLPQVFLNVLGTLDAAGLATATINVPFHPPLAGLPFYFAAATATATPSLVATEVSNRVTITFQ
jgi:hypothetical protein